MASDDVGTPAYVPLNVFVYLRKAEQIFVENEIWTSVNDRIRREVYDDVLHQLAKREKVGIVWYL